jgi:hypothetical protein
MVTPTLGTKLEEGGKKFSPLPKTMKTVADLIAEWHAKAPGYQFEQTRCCKPKIAFTARLIRILNTIRRAIKRNVKTAKNVLPFPERPKLTRFESGRKDGLAGSRKDKIRASRIGKHVQWHVNRGIQKPDCELCQLKNLPGRLSCDDIVNRAAKNQA